MKHKPLLFVILFLLFLLGAGYLFSAIFLPRYIEAKVLPHLGLKLSSSLHGQAYSIGFFNADFGDIILGSPSNPAASIGAIHAEYSLPSLLAKKIHRLDINGFFMQLDVSDGNLVIPGINLQEPAAPPSAQQPIPKPPEIALPVDFDHLRVTNGLVKISRNGRQFLIPFDLEIKKLNSGNNLKVYQLNLQAMPQGEAVALAGEIDLSGNTSNLTLSADSLDMSSFAHLADLGRHNINIGSVSLLGKAKINLAPLGLVTASLQIDPRSVTFGTVPVKFQQTEPDAGPAISMEIESRQEDFLLKAHGAVKEPLQAQFAFSGAFIHIDDALKGDGNMFLEFAPPADPQKYDLPFGAIQSSPEINAAFTFNRNKSGAWQAVIKNIEKKDDKVSSEEIRILIAKGSMEFELPSFHIEGQRDAGTSAIQVEFAVPKVTLDYDGVTITIPETTIKATYQQKLGQDLTHQAVVEAALPNTHIARETLAGTADIFLHGVMEPQLVNDLKNLQIMGDVIVNDGEMHEHDSKVLLSGLSGSIPWHWPGSGKERKGKINVSRINMQDHELGSFMTDIRLQDMTYFLEGIYTSDLFKGVAAKVTGKVENILSAYQAEVALHSDVMPFTAINLGKFDPSLNKSYFSGELGLDGSFIFATDGMSGTVQFMLQNGKYEFAEKKYEISGISFRMQMPSLPDLRSAPAQTLDFAEAALGNMSFSKGRFVWQLESAKSIFLEEGVVQWAGGRVFTNSVRISSEKKEIVVPIFCDRLKLTEILQQLGVSGARGEGTVNGRVPMRIGKDTVHFEDGFLYSSPGQGGSVKVSAFDILSAGIPKNTPQFAQVDFAAEALKNFQYNWVKLLLNTEGEDLIMQMQMDGKPLQSLPFTYDSSTGLLRRLDGAGPGIDQPIRLDVNFRLPLNRFLGYSDKIQEIMKKIK